MQFFTLFMWSIFYTSPCELVITVEMITTLSMLIMYSCKLSKKRKERLLITLMIYGNAHSAFNFPY